MSMNYNFATSSDKVTSSTVYTVIAKYFAECDNLPF